MLLFSTIAFPLGSFHFFTSIASSIPFVQLSLLPFQEASAVVSVCLCVCAYSCECILFSFPFRSLFSCLCHCSLLLLSSVWLLLATRAEESNGTLLSFETCAYYPVYTYERRKKQNKKITHVYPIRRKKKRKKTKEENYTKKLVGARWKACSRTKNTFSLCLFFFLRSFA